MRISNLFKWFKKIFIKSHNKYLPGGSLLKYPITQIIKINKGN